MSAELEPFPFVVGSPRSGTTLLQAMLDAHPELAIPPESHFIVPLAKRLGERWERGEDQFELFADTLLSRRRFKYWRMSRDEVLSTLREKRPDDLAGAVRTVFAAWARREGKRRYGDKTPRYIRHLPTIAGLLSDARFVHLIRDGRDVVLSTIEAFERGPRNAVQGALEWRADVDAGRRAGEDLGPERYLEVRYEDLVSDPEPVLRRIGGFIALPFDEAMLAHTERAAEVIARYPVGAPVTNVERAAAARRAWREEMSDEEVARFELVAGDLLSDLGYEHSAANGRGEGSDAERRAALLADELTALRGQEERERSRARRARGRLRALRRRPWWRLGETLSRALGRA